MLERQKKKRKKSKCVQSSLRRQTQQQQKRAASCGPPKPSGATAGCGYKHCKKSFHYPCAKADPRRDDCIVKKYTVQGKDCYRVFCSVEHQRLHKAEESQGAEFEYQSVDESASEAGSWSSPDGHVSDRGSAADDDDPAADGSGTSWSLEDDSGRCRSCSDIFDPVKAASCVVWLSDSTDDSASTCSESMLQSYSQSLLPLDDDDDSDVTGAEAPSEPGDGCAAQHSSAANLHPLDDRAGSADVPCPVVVEDRPENVASTTAGASRRTPERSGTNKKTPEMSPVCCSFSQVMGDLAADGLPASINSLEIPPQRDMNQLDTERPAESRKIVIGLLDKVDCSHDDFRALLTKHSKILKARNICLSDIIIWNHHCLNLISHCYALHLLVDVCSQICHSGTMTTEELLATLIGGQWSREREYTTATRLNTRLGVDDGALRAALLKAAATKVNVRQSSSKCLLPAMTLVFCSNVRLLLITAADDDNEGDADSSSLSQWLRQCPLRRESFGDGDCAALAWGHGTAVLSSPRRFLPTDSGSSASPLTTWQRLRDAVLDLEQSALVGWLEAASDHRYSLSDLVPNDDVLAVCMPDRRRLATLASRLRAARGTTEEFGLPPGIQPPDGGGSARPPCPCLFVHPPDLDPAVFRTYVNEVTCRFVRRNLSCSDTQFVVLVIAGSPADRAKRLDAVWTCATDELPRMMLPTRVVGDVMTGFDLATSHCEVHYAAMRIRLVQP